MKRRDFLRGSALASSGLLVGYYLGSGSLFSASKSPTSYSLNPFLFIDTNGSVSMVNPNPDLGQASAQAAAALVAEELSIRVEDISIIQSKGELAHGPLQLAGGSGAVRRAWEPLRKAGAAAREMLCKAAAEKWRVPRSSCVVEKGVVINTASRETFGFGDLVTLASTYEVPGNPPLKQKSDFTVIGKQTRRPDLRDRITGKTVYGIDVYRDQMLHAVVLHGPAFGATIRHLDDSAARNLEGVVDVVKIERVLPHIRYEAVGIVAHDTWSAIKARRLLNVEWNLPTVADSMQQHIDKCKDAFEEPKNIYTNIGNFPASYQTASIKAEAVYISNAVAHAPIEPESCVAEYKPETGFELWVAAQTPVWVKNDVSKYFNISPEDVTVNIYNMGGSFGRKAYHDFVLEACILAQKHTQPVKVLWTREDDLAQGPFRLPTVSRMKGFIHGRKVSGFHHFASGETIGGQLHGDPVPGDKDDGICHEIGFENSHYTFAHGRISYKRVATDIPIVWWRSVYPGSYAWAQECFLDELAHAGKLDPLTARKDLLTDVRFIKVLDVLEEKSGYRLSRPANTGFGMAIWRSFDSISAAGVFVSRGPEGVRVDKVISILDCGLVVNEDMVRAQMEGSVIMGLSAATKEEILVDNGKSLHTNFHEYTIGRMHDMPMIETYIIADQDTPGGVGEPALPPVAPALGNAIFNLTGKRLRSLPIDLTTI